MSPLRTRLRVLSLLISTAALASYVPLAAAATLTHACASVDACVAAIAGAAKESDSVGSLAAVTRLSRLPKAPVQEVWQERSEIIAAGDPDAISRTFISSVPPSSMDSAEVAVTLAYHYRQLNRHAEAERVLKNMLALEPYQAPVWDALATTFAAQGRLDDALGALLVAHEWAQAPTAVLAAYERAAGAGQAVYEQAVQRIRAKLAAHAALDATLPPLPSTKDDLRGKVEVNTDCKPEWPKSSLRFEEQGTATLAFFVDADGKLVRAKKIKSSGTAALDNAAMVAVSGCNLLPAVRDGKKTPSWIQLQYQWTLE